MPWPTPNVLGSQFDAKFGRWGGPQNWLYSPTQLPNLSAWFDALDTQTMLAGDGTIVTDGGTVCLWKDKSGNSGVNALVLNGALNNVAYVLDAENLDIVGDLELVVKVALPDWTPSATQYLISKMNDGVSRSYRVAIDTSGNVQLQWSVDGSAITTATSTTDTGVSDFSASWIKATLDVDNGASGYDVNFYKSPDGVTWTKIGNTVTGGAPTSIAVTTSRVDVGATFSGLAGPSAGLFYRAIIKDGIDSTTALDIDFTTAPTKLSNGDTFTCTTGQTVTLNSSGATGARIAGERDLFQGTAANRPVLLQYSGTKYGYVGGIAGSTFTTHDSDALAPGDLDVTIRLRADSYTPAARNGLIWHGSTAGQKSWSAEIENTTGKVRGFFSADGTNSVIYSATTGTGFAANADAWLRFTFVQNTGGNSVFAAFTSTDGVNWTGIGGETKTALTLFNSNEALGVGALTATSFPLFGRVFYAAVSIGGAVKVIFDPTRYVSGTTFTASTGEVWTVNGGAHIVTRTGLYFPGATQYVKSAAFPLSQPETVYGVLNPITWTNFDCLYDGGGSLNMALSQTNGSPNVQIVTDSGSTYVASLAAPLQTAGVYSSGFNGASSFNRLNRGTAATGNPGAQAGNGFTAGSRGNGGNNANIFVSELILRSAADNTATQDRIALYAGRKWGFAV